MSEQLLTAKQAAKRLGCATATSIPCGRAGREGLQQVTVGGRGSSARRVWIALFRKAANKSVPVIQVSGVQA